MTLKEKIVHRFLVLCSLFGSAASAEHNTRPRANTTCGVVVGIEQPGSVAAFRGIPYGSAERFQPPKPAHCWHGELNATEDGPYCPGMHPPYDKHMAEDCLSLNVFAPLKGGSKPLPVLVWIHGGSLVSGSAASYGPIENLVAGSQRVLLVAMNYRLGALGFAALPELAAADPRGVSGNYGLIDQQLAMRWVAANAAAFGGDPSKVTLIGQSSGGTSILGHLAAPASAGLFRAAISLSASPNISLANAEKEAQDAAHWLAHTPCAKTTRGPPTLACLRGASVAELQGALEPQYDFFDFNSSFSYEPVPPGRGIGGPVGRMRWAALMHVDGVTINRGSVEVAKAGYGAALLLQSLESEHDWNPAEFLEEASSREAAAELVEGLLEPGFGRAQSRALYARYAGVGGGNATLAAAPAYALNADTGITCGSLVLARAAAGACRGGSAGGSAGGSVGGSAGGSAGCSAGGKKVYLSQVTARPTHPLHAWNGKTCAKPCKYAFHLWDWVAAMRAAAPANATSVWPQNQCGHYGPSDDDVAFGRVLLEQWVTFAEHAGFPAASGGGEGAPAADEAAVGWRAVAFGRALLEQWVTFPEHAGFPAASGGGEGAPAADEAAVGWRAVDEAEGWPRHYIHGVIGPRGATKSVVDYKAADCAAWRAAGVGQAWWWIN